MSIYSWILLVVGETSAETLVSLVFAINLLWYIPELVYQQGQQIHAEGTLGGVLIWKMHGG
jgi:hypothetical protein